MSDLQAESNVITSQKPIPRIKDISMMKAWKDSKVRFGTLLNRSITEMEPVPVTGQLVAEPRLGSAHPGGNSWRRRYGQSGPIAG